MAPQGGEKAPASDGRGAHFLDYEHQVHLWMRTTRNEASGRASVLILRTQPAPRRVCLAEGSDIMSRSDGVTKILKILRKYFAPEAADAIRQQVMRYMRSRRPDRSIDEYIPEYDLLRRKAKSKMEMGTGSPAQFTPVLRMDNAAVPRHAKSLVMARCQKSLRFEDVSANLRRLFGSRGTPRERRGLGYFGGVQESEKTSGGEEKEGGPQKRVGAR